MRTVIAVMLVGGVLASAARADDRADQQRAAQRTALEQQKKMQEGYINRLELMPGGKKKIEELVRVGLEGGKLAIKSPLFDPETVGQMKNRQMRAEVEGFEGFCTIMVQPIGKGSYFFTFSNVQYPNLEGTSNFNMNVQPGLLSLSKNFSSSGRHSNVNFVQSSGRGMFGQPDGVQMSVYGMENGRAGTNVNISAPDFMTLRRKYPREVNEHLRPLLRELRLENLFAVDPTTAWQVFADEWRGNAAVEGRIKALLPALEADGYADREAARQKLQQLGADAALVIYRMERAGLTAEQNCQLDAVLASHAFLSRPEADRLASDVDFLLDCLYADDADLRDTALKRLRGATKRELAFDPKDTYDARVTRVESLRAELARNGTTTRSAKG